MMDDQTMAAIYKHNVYKIDPGWLFLWKYPGSGRKMDILIMVRMLKLKKMSNWVACEQVSMQQIDSSLRVWLNNDVSVLNFEKTSKWVTVIHIGDTVIVWLNTLFSLDLPQLRYFAHQDKWSEITTDYLLIEHILK